eukprot:GHVN01066905.1.p1 GENE.GHVN01066905.1~~GHVN01066905.1.p1  ORF type:complete len:1058 (-),score=120.38 GHVN01066905.1:1246-4419(-)
MIEVSPRVEDTLSWRRGHFGIAARGNPMGVCQTVYCDRLDPRRVTENDCLAVQHPSRVEEDLCLKIEEHTIAKVPKHDKHFPGGEQHNLTSIEWMGELVSPEKPDKMDMTDRTEKVRESLSRNNGIIVTSCDNGKHNATMEVFNCYPTTSAPLVRGTSINDLGLQDKETFKHVVWSRVPRTPRCAVLTSLGQATTTKGQRFDHRCILFRPDQRSEKASKNLEIGYSCLEWMGSTESAIVFGCKDGKIKLFDVPNLKDKAAFPSDTTRTPTSPVRSLHCRADSSSVDGPHVLLTASDSDVRVFDMRDLYKCSAGLRLPAVGGAARWNPHDNHLFAAAANESVCVFDVRQHSEPVATLKLPFTCKTLRWRPGYPCQLTTSYTTQKHRHGFHLWDFSLPTLPILGCGQPTDELDWINTECLVSIGSSRLTLHAIGCPATGNGRPLANMRTVGMSWAPIPNTPRSVASSNSTVAGSLFQDARASSRFATFLCGRSDVHASDVAAAISSRPIPPITRLPAGQTPTEERRKMKAEYRYPADLHAYPLESVTWNGSKFPRNLVNVRPKEYPRTTQPIKRPQQDILHLDSNRGVQTVPADPPRGVRSTGKMDPAAGGRRHEVVKAWFTDTIGDEGVMAPVDEEEDDQPYLMDQSSPVFSLEGCPSPPHGGMSNRLNPESAHPRTTTGLPPPTTSALDIDGSLRYDATDKVRMPADTHAFLSDINLSGIEVPPNLLNPQKRPVTRPMRVFSFGRVAPRAVPVGITPTPLPVDHCTSKQESTSENSRLPARQPHIRSLLNYLAKRGPYPSPLPWHSPISDLAYANPLEAIGVAGWECQPLRSLGLMSALIDVVPTIRIFLHVPFKYLSLWLRGYIRRNRLDKLYLDHLNNLEDPRFAEAGNRLSRMTAGVGAPSEGAVEPMIRHVSFSKQAAAKPHSGFFQRPPRFYVPQRLWLSENDTPRAPSHDRRWPPVEAYRHQTDHLINKLNARVNGDDTVALTELELIELCEHLVRISAIRYGRLPRTILLVSDMSGENLFPFGMRLPPHEVRQSASSAKTHNRAQSLSLD